MFPLKITGIPRGLFGFIKLALIPVELSFPLVVRVHNFSQRYATASSTQLSTNIENSWRSILDPPALSTLDTLFASNVAELRILQAEALAITDADKGYSVDGDQEVKGIPLSETLPPALQETLTACR